MKRRIFACVLAVIMLAALSVTAFAASNKPAFDSSYDADTNTVSVKIYVESPGALEAADFCLAFDPDVYEYVDCSASSMSDDAMIIAGQAGTEDGLVTCSLIFTEACADSDLDADGNLYLATFQFKPLTEDYDIDDFCLWADSYSVGGANIINTISPVGNTVLKSGHTSVVTTPNNKNNSTQTTAATTTAKADDNNDGNEAANDNAVNNANANSQSTSSSSKSGTKWYVYVIAGVLAVGAVAGIAMVAIKNNKEEENGEKAENDNSDSAEK